MDLSSILSPSAIRIVSSVSSKKRLLQKLCDLSIDAYGLDGSAAFTALQQRENLGPTGVGNGVALPHARLQGLDRVVGCFMRLDVPLEFEAVDKQPVDLFFALFAPEGSGVEHLKALALVSRSLRDSSVCAKLRANDDPVTIHALLTDSLSNRAA